MQPAKRASPLASGLESSLGFVVCSPLSWLTQTVSHIKNFLDCVHIRKQPNATIEIGHQAVWSLHLANIAYREKARAVLAEDELTVRG